MKSSGGFNDQSHNTAGCYQPPPAYNYQSIMGNGNQDDPIPNFQSPSYQKVERPAGQADDPLSSPSPSATVQKEDSDNQKTCRICLEDDATDTMIAPCRCKGWSKWVHRDCLDEWRLQESDRAFSKCTECLFDYYMQPVYNDADGTIHRRIKFYWNVSRDVCLGTLTLQLMIVVLAGLIYACDTNRALPKEIMPAFQSHPWSLYYLLGWLLLLVFTGIYGSVVLCYNGCSISKSLPQFNPPSATPIPAATSSNSVPNVPSRSGSATPPISGVTTENHMARGMGMESTTEYYRRARHRRQRNYHADQQRGYHYNNNRDTCCDSCTYCCNRQPVLIYDPYGCCYGCCCCDDYPYGRSTQDTECCGCCDCGNCSGGDGGNQDCGECVHVLLLILLAFAIILAVIGFFVGIVITVIAFQRVVQRHVHLLQKKQLVQEYQVMDLQGYDLDHPLPIAPHADDLEWNGNGAAMAVSVAPSAPIEPLPEKDISYLQKLGLKE